MKNVNDSFVSFGPWSFAGSLRFNTDILATNPINLSVVIGVLIFFVKGVLSDLLDNRKQSILNTIRNSKELCVGAIEQMEKAKARLRKAEMKADQFRMNGYSEIEREKFNLVNSTYKILEQLETYKNEKIPFEQQRVINQVRQRVFQQALQGAIGTLNSCLTAEVHLHTISINIGMLGAIKEITD
uniref:CF0 subunit I n=1 Tax=Gleadovia mupinensis TaxID=2028288 RepID=UPI0030022DB0|nr:CF0 subunit I [Gleadovia mupinensis]